MTYEISWYIPNRVMLIKVSGNIDLEEFECLHNEAFEYVSQSHFKVHAIADLSEFKAIPTNIRLLFSASNTEKDHKQGMTVLVQPKMPAMIRFVASLIMQTLRLEYRVCETMEDAMKILHRVDLEIPTVPIL